MQTVKATHVLTIRTSLTTETLCVCAVLYWEILLVEDNVTVDVCYRNLCGWDKVEVVYLTMVHLTFLVRKLSCAIA